MTARMKKWLPQWAPVMPELEFLGALFFAALLDNAAPSLPPPRGALWYSYYQHLATDAFYLRALFETVALAFVPTLVCLVIGYPVAFYLVRHAQAGRTLIIFLL